MFLGFVQSVSALTNCQKSIIQQITNVYENSNPNFQFDYCEDIKDGRGFTCGIVGFTTGTGDALQVIQSYHGPEFKKYVWILQEIKGKNLKSVSGLDGFCGAWKSASRNINFREIQIDKMLELYYYPAEAHSNALGLRLPVSRGQFYDTAIQMGLDQDYDTLEDLTKRVRLPLPTSEFEEMEWIKDFMRVRKHALCHPHDRSTQVAWCEAISRIKSYEYLLNRNPVFEDSAEILDNDGNSMTIVCNLNLEMV